MKKLLIALLIALPAFAATPVSFNISDANAARIDRERLRVNKVACESFGLAANCTQAQARNAFCAREGASAPTHPCTYNGVASDTVRVYPDVSTFVDVEVIKEYTRELKARQDQADKATWDATLAAANQASKDAACAAVGLPAGCLP